MDTVLRSRSGSVTIGARQPFCVIGERINPTGRKKFAEELRNGDLSTVTVDALAQAEAGANMLDVNAGIPLVDEPELLKSMLRTVQEAVDVPICIDSSVIEALGPACRSMRDGRSSTRSLPRTNASTRSCRSSPGTGPRSSAWPTTRPASRRRRRSAWSAPARSSAPPTTTGSPPRT